MRFIVRFANNIYRDLIGRVYQNPFLHELVVVFQKVCLGRRLQILQICKYSDSWFRTTRRGVWI